MLTRYPIGIAVTVVAAIAGRRLQHIFSLIGKGKAAPGRTASFSTGQGRDRRGRRPTEAL